MPIAPDTNAGKAVVAAEREAATWVTIVARVLEVFPTGGPTEAEVIRFHDPSGDLERRGAAWQWDPVDPTLAGVARFAGGLAVAEAEARARGDEDIALKAYFDRRHLVGDRLVHWAVPVLVAAQDGGSGVAGSAADLILQVGDDLRPAPMLGGREGVDLPGHDSFGPILPRATTSEWEQSLWSGWAARSGDRVSAGLYEAAASKWRELARDHPGTARLWHDLAERAARTADLAIETRKA